MSEKSSDPVVGQQRSARRYQPLWAGAIGAVAYLSAQISIPWNRSTAPIMIAVAVAAVALIGLLAMEARRRRT
jgi:lysozyme family protein